VTRKFITLAFIAGLAAAAAGCGVADQGRAPVVIRVDDLSASSGAGSQNFGGYLHSDVVTNVTVSGVSVPTRFNDVGRVTLSLRLKDAGAPGVANTPSELNTVTFTRYRVVYRRTDGRNVQGVDVPYAFDSGMTISVPVTSGVQQTFDIVRVSAKLEPPLLALATNGLTIDAIVDVTFYGKDMHNNDVAVTGSIGVTFANFGDSTS
jgi:hypothetical protein